MLVQWLHHTWRSAIPLTSDVFQPTVILPLTMNSRSPYGTRMEPCQILFPWQTYSAHQTERPCSCTQTLNNRMLVLWQKWPGPFFGEGVMWAGGQIFQGFCNKIIFCNVPLNGSDCRQICENSSKRTTPCHNTHHYLMYTAIKYEALQCFTKKGGKRRIYL